MCLSRGTSAYFAADPFRKSSWDGLIAFQREEENRKLYGLTALGQEVLALELKRIERLYRNSKGESMDE